MLDDLFGDLTDYVHVGEHQVIAAHAGLAGDTGGDDHNVGVRGFCITVGTHNTGI